MPTLYSLKPIFQERLRPTADELAAQGFTANQVTLLGLGLSIAVGILVTLLPNWTVVLLLVPIALFVRMALNAIDGMLAREHNQASRLGTLLNELCDLGSDAALYLPLALVSGLSASLVIINVVLALISEGAGMAAKLVGADRRYDGPFGKSDRALGFGGLAILAAFGILSPGLLNFALVAFAGFSLWTIANRVNGALEAGPAA